MSETVSAPAVGVETSEPSTDADYNAIVEQLNEGGLAPSVDQDDPDQQDAPDGEDDGEDDGEPKIKLKVNGKTLEHTQAEVVKMAQLYKATEMKLETAKKEIEQTRAVQQQLESPQTAVKNLLSIMQKGDLDTISEFVHDKLQAGKEWDQAIIKHALKLYEMAKMSPEQREALENRKLVTKLRQEAEERQKSEQQRAWDYQVNQWQEHISVEVPKAIKEVGLPDTAFVREHIISTWRAAIERGKTPTAKAVANFIKERLAEAKMLGQPMAEVQTLVRPKATSESVRGKANGKIEETGYKSWDDWKKTRSK